jgi:hypothetical protein
VYPARPSVAGLQWLWFLLLTLVLLLLLLLPGKQGRDLRQGWLREIGCLDGSPIITPHRDATTEQTGAAELSAADRAKIGHAAKGPALGATCQYCSAFGTHVNAASWEVALGGVVGDEMSASGVAGEPKWAAKLQKIRHWFIPPVA